MSVYSNSNITSLRAQSHLAKAQAGLAGSFERLASGRRINSADDDAGGIALSVSLKSQTRSFAVAERNGMNALSMVETAEGGLSEIHGTLGRMRELAMQSANGDLAKTDRINLETEYQELMGETQRVLDTTEYNGRTLLGGKAFAAAFQVGIKTTLHDVIGVKFGGLSTSKTGLGISLTNVKTAENAKLAMDRLDNAMEGVSRGRVRYGASANRLRVAVSNANTMRTNLAAASSRITDVDVAVETAELARSQVLQQAAASMLSQANQAPQIALALMR